jgi:hypothetical protein
MRNYESHPSFAISFSLCLPLLYQLKILLCVKVEFFLHPRHNVCKSTPKYLPIGLHKVYLQSDQECYHKNLLFCRNVYLRFTVHICILAIHSRFIGCLPLEKSIINEIIINIKRYIIILMSHREEIP